MNTPLGRMIRSNGVQALVCGLAIAVGYVALCAEEARGQTVTGPGFITLDQLRRMSQVELEQVYRQGTATGIPEGPIRGTALLAPGTRRARSLSRGARLVWQGKVFEPGQTTAVNRFFGMRIVRARSIRGQAGSTGSLRSYSTTARRHASTPTIATRSAKLHPGFISDSCTTAGPRRRDS